MKERNSSFELLKIICMMSIVSLHFITQSSIITIYCEVNSCFWIIMKSYGRIACTVFFMISAWFLCTKSFDINRIVNIELGSLMYGIFFYGLGCILNLDKGDITLLTVFTPTLSMPLWFTSIYMEILILMPVLNSALEVLDRKTLFYVISFILIPILFVTTLVNFDFRFVKEFVFYPIVYLQIGYIRKYCNLKNKWLWALVAILSFSFIVILQEFRNIFPEFQYAKLISEYGAYYSSRFWTFPNYICALSSFLFFANIKIPSCKFLNILAKPTLGIYLIHQNHIFYPFLWKMTDLFITKYIILNEYFTVFISIISLYVLFGFIEITRTKLIHTLHAIIKNCKERR